MWPFLGPDAIASYNRKVSATTAADGDAVARHLKRLLVIALVCPINMRAKENPGSRARLMLMRLRS